MRNFSVIACLFLLIVIFAGCSSTNQPVTPGSSDTPQAFAQTSKQEVLFSGMLDIDLENMTISTAENRQADYVYNITGFLPDKCPGGCFRFRILSINGTVLEIELTLENPLPIQAYDLRCVYKNLYGKKVLNPDSYTDFSGSIVTRIFPFTAFATEYPNRAFPVGPGGTDTEILLLDFPSGSSGAVSFILTASYPMPTQDPYEISEMDQDGILTPSGGNATISCRVYDHQNDVSSVQIDTRLITGSVLAMTEDLADPGLYNVEVSNTEGAPIGTYSLMIMASSPNPQNIHTYNFVNVTVTDITTDVIYVDNSYVGPPYDGTQEHPFITIPDGLNAAPDGYEVWVDDSGIDYAGPISTKSNVILKSVNWDLSDGTDMASIYSAQSAIVNVVENSTIDGFKIYGSSDTGIYIGGNNGTVRNCWITDIIKTADSGIVEGMRISNCDSALVEFCEFSNIQLNANSGIIDSIYSLGATNVTIRNCRIHDFQRNTESGILIPVYFNTVDGAYFSNNIIYNMYASSSSALGAVYFNTTTNSVVANNTIYNLVNGTGLSFGISVDSESFFFNGYNNIITGYAGTGISIGEPGAMWNYNDVFNLDSSTPPGVGNINADPMFVNPGIDFHLQSGSPCIDTGDPLVFDFNSTRSDMGAYGGPGGNW